MAATFDQYDKSRYVRENSHVLIHRTSVMLALSIIGVMAFEIAYQAKIAAADIVLQCPVILA